MVYTLCTNRKISVLYRGERWGVARTGVFVLVFYELKRPISSFAEKQSMILV